MVKTENIKNKEKELLKKSEGLFKDFKTFISKGNVVDLAVGIIIGGAFSTIVSSLVNDIVMPIIGALFSDKRFEDLSFTLNKVEIKYGTFIQNVVDFFIVALCVFFIIKVLSKFKKKEEKKEEVKKSEEVILLEQIRDLLKK